MRRILKILLKIVLGVLILGLVAFGIIYAIYNEKLPEGRSGPEADALAENMLATLNYKQYQNTRFLEWSYQGGKNKYKWDKENGSVVVKWDNYEVKVDLIAPESSLAFKNGERLNENENQDIVEKAIDYFNNDSFWLVAPYKVFDKGALRSIVALEDGSEALLVTYTSGGTTPGDSYLWILQPNGFPKSFKMWVKIIPIGGLEATWDDWLVTRSGAFLPKSHEFGPFTLSLGDVEGYNNP
ncbi:hypothetical protein [Maribacter aestuarii]|uniref:hypothetical protein n=1 Tax=Maribacter aestuarii TaxID=1130723 RepID=UPI00248D0D6F|nr:hypothetical protein [Maribacter aestuarii]